MEQIKGSAHSFSTLAQARLAGFTSVTISDQGQYLKGRKGKAFESFPSSFGFAFVVDGKAKQVWRGRVSVYGKAYSVFGIRVSVFGRGVSVFGSGVSVFGSGDWVFGSGDWVYLSRVSVFGKGLGVFGKGVSVFGKPFSEDPNP